MPKFRIPFSGQFIITVEAEGATLKEAMIAAGEAANVVEVEAVADVQPVKDRIEEIIQSTINKKSND